MKLKRHRWDHVGHCFLSMMWWIRVWKNELNQIVSAELYGTLDGYDSGRPSISIHPFYVVKGKSLETV